MHEDGAILEVADLLAQQPGADLAIGGEGAPARADASERRCIVRVYVAQVADQVHDLVVAEEHLDLASGRGTFALQLAPQLDDPDRVGAAVKAVAGVHQSCRARPPHAQ